MVMMEAVPVELVRILRETPALHRAYLVGGCVRDALAGIPNKDFDVEVFGVAFEELAEVLALWGQTNLVGRSFGVVKLTTRSAATFDFTIPRRDSKIAPGHKGFEVYFDPTITPEEAAARRDFTINSLMYDPRREEVLDFFGGARDLQNRILRHTSPAFTEDPLRVLRGMQFAGRFDLSAPPETIDICRRMKAAYNELALERVREEWFKWAAKSRVPSAGLRFLAATEWLEHFPEVRALQDTPQEPSWHPEGDVFVHTCHSCDALVRLPDWQNTDETSRIIYSLAVLTHDLGKALTTQKALKDGEWRIVSPGHEEASGTLAETFLNRLRVPNAIVERVLPLVRQHMAHLDQVTDRSVRRLAKRLEPETIQGLSVIMTADAMGRPPIPPRVPKVVTALQAKAAELQVQASAPKPILMGRHLLELGMQPGPKFGAILSEAFEAQIEGTFFDLDHALAWLGAQNKFRLSGEERCALSKALNR